MHSKEIFSLLNEDNDTRHYRYTEFDSLPDKVKKEIEGREKILNYKSFDDLPTKIKNRINKQSEIFANKSANKSTRESTKKKNFGKKKDELTNKYLNKYHSRGDSREELTNLYNLEQHKRVFQSRVNKNNENKFSGNVPAKVEIENKLKIMEKNIGFEKLNIYSKYNYNRNYSKLSLKEKVELFNRITDNRNKSEYRKKITKELETENSNYKNNVRTVNKNNAIKIVNSYPSAQKSTQDERDEYINNKLIEPLSGNDSLEDKISKGDVMSRCDKNKPYSKNSQDVEEVLSIFDKGTSGEKKFDDVKFRKKVIKILNNRSLNPLVKTGDINNNKFQHLLKIIKTGSKYGKGSLTNLSVSEQIAKDSMIHHMDDKTVGEKKEYFNEPDLNNERMEEGYRLQHAYYHKNLTNIFQLITNLEIYNSGKSKNIPNFYILLNKGTVQPDAYTDKSNKIPNVSPSAKLHDERITKGIDGIGYYNGKIIFAENKASHNPKSYTEEVKNFIKNCTNANVDIAIWNYDGHWTETALSNLSTISSWKNNAEKNESLKSLIGHIVSYGKNIGKGIDFKMMPRADFNEWLKTLKIPSVPVPKNLSPSKADKFKEQLTIFLKQKNVNWSQSEKYPNAPLIGSRKKEK